MSDTEQSDRDFEDWMDKNARYEKQLNFFMLIGMREKNRFVAQMYKQTLDGLNMAHDHKWPDELRDDLQAFLGKILDVADTSFNQLDALSDSQRAFLEDQWQTFRNWWDGWPGRESSTGS